MVRGVITQVGSLSFFDNLVWPRIKRMAKKEKVHELFTYAWFKAIDRTGNRSSIINKTLDLIGPLLERAEENEIDEWLNKERGKILAKYGVSEIEKIKKSVNRHKLRNFKKKIKNLKETLSSRKDIYPLHAHLIWALDFLVRYMEDDFRMLKEKTPEEYYEIFKSGLERFPGKILLFYAPILALHAIITGLSLKQKARLSKAYRKIEGLYVNLEELNLPSLPNKSLNKIKLLER